MKMGSCFLFISDILIQLFAFCFPFAEVIPAECYTSTLAEIEKEESKRKGSDDFDKDDIASESGPFALPAKTKRRS